MYKLNISTFTKQPCSVNRKNEDGSITSIPFVDDNTDYQAYLAWVALGNQPTPADEVTL
jgi:hypothetical protein